MHGTLSAPRRRPIWALPLTLRLAVRELRGGLRGFGVFLACIGLGVAAIAGVSSVSRSLGEGLIRQGRVILGGDLAVSLVQRPAEPQQLAFLSGQGRVSSIVTLRAMALAGDKGAALIEAKAVDGTYPAAGLLVTEPAVPRDELFAERGGVYGAVVEPTLLGRLDLKLGDRVTVGSAVLELRARLVSEPDKIATGIGFGPRLLMSQDALQATGLVQPGSLVRWTYRVALPPGRAGDADLTRATEALTQAFPDAGWEIRSRANAEPRFAANIERFTQFLTLVGLTALLVGGVGVANAVAAFVDRKRESVAVLKSLGATGGQVVSVYLIQVLLIALVGIAAGLAVGAALPFAVAALFGAAIPIPIEPALAPGDLALAALYGLLVALAFALAPLGRANQIAVSGLFRDRVEPEGRASPLPYRAGVAAAVLALVALAIVSAYDRRIALIFVASSAAVFLLLRIVAAGVMALARRWPRTRHPTLRLAIANIHRPGALTPSLILSLGLGITLLVTLAVIDANLTRQLTRTLPAKAPSFFFLDIPNVDAGRFDAFLQEAAPGSRIERVPMMRGRLVALKGIPVSEIRAEDQVRWVLEGDRGITYAETLPEGSTLTAGEWWPVGYRGPPLVSFDSEIAKSFGLGVGDALTVNVLGRNVTARIANLRKVEWRSLGINFVMVFSPNSFAGAPHTHLATVTYPNGTDPDAEAVLLRKAATGFPSVSSVRVKDALDAVNLVVAQLVAAIRGASAVALAASLLVLAGALAAGHRARLYDAVVLKTLGATRARLLASYALEYGTLGLATALFGLIAGTGAAAAILTQVMRLPFSWELAGAIASAALAILVTIGLGLAATWRILGQKPASYLRDL